MLEKEFCHLGGSTFISTLLAYIITAAQLNYVLAKFECF